MTKDKVYTSRIRPSEVTATSGSKFIGATLMYLSIALVITFAVVGIMGSLLSYAIFNGSVQSAEVFVSLFLVALLAYIPILIWVRIAALRDGRSVGPAFFAYSIVMGLLISPICVVYDFWTIVIALGTTCLSFGVMALIAWNTKKDLTRLALFGTGLLLGAFIIALFNFIIYLFIGFQPMYWLVSFLFFIAIIILTVVDLNNVKQIAMNGGAGKNIALLCALNLYVDFIYIFIRLLRIIGYLRSR